MSNARVRGKEGLVQKDGLRWFHVTLVHRGNRFLHMHCSGPSGEVLVDTAGYVAAELERSSSRARAEKS